MASTRTHNTDSRSAPPHGADWKVLGMRVQYQLQAHLGRSLQVAYQPVLEEPVPRKLLKLLDGLQRKEEES
jgi:hypothetical protein